MAIMLTKRSSTFIKQGAILPVPPANFVETNKPVLIVPEFSRVQSNRMSGEMNSSTEFIDTCRSKATFEVATNIFTTGTAQLDIEPAYAEIMKISGFKKKTALPDTCELVNDTDGIDSGSGIIYMDNKKYTFTDTLVGSLTATFEIGKASVLSVVCSGYIDDVEAVDEVNPQVALTDEPALIVSCADIYLFDNKVVPAESIVIKTNPEITESYTMGGTQGIKKNTITDYSLTMEATFPLDGADYATHAQLIKDGITKTVKIILGADKAGNPIDGKSVVIMADATQVVSYEDNDVNGLLYRTVSYKIQNSGITPAIRWITGKTAGL